MATARRRTPPWSAGSWSATRASPTSPRSPTPTDPLDLNVVVTGGAGAIEPAVRWSRADGLRLARAGDSRGGGLGDDLARNASRVVAMVDNLRSEMGDDVEVYVEPPRRVLVGDQAWLAALDEISTAGPPAQVPHRWRDRRRVPVRRRARRRASTRRSTGSCRSSAPPACTTRSRHTDPETGFEHHGFLNVLLATRAALDGGDVDGVAAARRRDAGHPAARPPRGLCVGAALVHLVRLVQRARRRTRTSSDARPAGRTTHEPTWVEGAAGSPYDVDNLPYGVFSTATARHRGSACAIGDFVLDLAPVAAGRDARRRATPSRRRRSTRSWRWAGRPGPRCAPGSRDLLTDEAERDLVEPHLVAGRPRSRCTCRSRSPTTSTSTAREHHATNVGRIFRPDGEPLHAELAAPADRLPRPRRHGRGLRHRRHRARTASARRRPRRPRFGPSQRLDIEAELGFVVGAPAALGEPVAGRRLRRPRVRRRACSTTGPPATSRPGSTCRSARSSASRSRPRSPPGSCRSPRSTPPGSTCPARTRRRCPTCASTASAGLDIDIEVRAQRRGRQPAAVRVDVLVARPDARAPDRQRRLAAHRRPVRLRHRLRRRSADQRGSFLELTWGGTEPVTAGGRSARSSRTATRSCCAPPRPAPWRPDRARRGQRPDRAGRHG